MGTTYHALERHGDAVESYKKALQINPGSPEVHNNLGVTLHALGRFDEAIECYRTAQQINSRHVEAHNNLGITLAELDRPNEAIDCYEAALRLYPGFADARNNLGRALASLGRHDEAIESYAIALEINPHEPKAPNNLGISLSALGQHAQAIDYYGRALEIDPTYVDAYNNLGNSLAEMDRCDEAIESYSKALAIDPDQGLVAAQRLHLMAHMCDWAALAHHRDAIPSLGVTGDVVSPFAMLSLEDNPERHFVRARRYAADRFGTIEQRPVAPPAEAKQHLRIGYFSADFHSHAVMHLMARLFALHDRNRFVVEAYSFGPDKRDDMRARLVDTFDEFYDVQQESNREVAALARRNGVDIAVDLNGYTEHARTGIFAHRAAPVQINYLGYPGTMGAPFMDYIVSDKTVIPETHRQHFSEKMIYLPHAFMVNDNTRAISDGPLTRAAFGLPETGFVFCCFNNNNKIFPEEFDLWMGLLKQIDGSVLWLRRANQWAVGNLRTEAQARGIDPDRLIFAEMLPFPEHLARHRLADLFLDTFNYNAHSTASEALWAGLPIVTRRGQGFPARVAASLLTAVEVPELITETANEYEALAVSLATDPDRLTGIKAKLQQNRETTSLFDTERFTRHLEAAFQQAYQRFSDGLPPDTIIVEGAA
jgi:predicted O-linked N-acetylglucosamine transferase (SPINDLY family)